MTTQGRTGSGSPWDYIQDWDVELVGPEIRDPLAVGRWARAFALAGGLGYMWNELARPVSEIVYGLLELRPGDKVLIIGEAVGPAGWEEDMRAIVGPSGAVDVVEILPQGRRAVAEQWRGRNGMLGCWRWDYTEAMESESYDCVAIMQSTQHCDDWSDVGPEVLRVMKPGRRIVFAEMVLGGPRFDQRVGADLHVRQCTRRSWAACATPWTESSPSTAARTCCVPWVTSSRAPRHWSGRGSRCSGAGNRGYQLSSRLRRGRRRRRDRTDRYGRSARPQHLRHRRPRAHPPRAAVRQSECPHHQPAGQEVLQPLGIQPPADLAELAEPVLAGHRRIAPALQFRPEAGRIR